MKPKHALGLAAALGLTALVVSALGQDLSDSQARDSTNGPLVAPGPPSAGIAPAGMPGGVGLGPGHPGPITSDRLSTETDQLARQLGEAKTDADREAIKGKMVQVLEKQFDQRRRRHEAEIEALEAQVRKLKDLVRVRNENRSEIVSRRLEQILSDAQGLGW
jgi:hypothetical protein